jgi:hypothetical protein
LPPLFCASSALASFIFSFSLSPFNLHSYTSSNSLSLTPPYCPVYRIMF